ETRRLRQLTSQRFWFGGTTASLPIFEDYPQFDLDYNRVTPEADSENEWLDNILHYSQINAAFDTGIAGRNTIPSDQLKDRFHDVTGVNYGVLAATDGSGLKRDLSFTGAGGEYRRFLDGYMNDMAALTPNMGGAEYVPVATPATTTLAAGAPAYFVAPVVSEAVFRFSIWQDDPAAGAVQVRSEADVELWNPYTVDLDLS